MIEKVKEYFEQYLKTEDGEKDICGEKIASLDGKIKMDYCSDQWSLPIKLQNGMILMFWSGGHLDNHRNPMAKVPPAYLPFHQILSY